MKQDESNNIALEDRLQACDRPFSVKVESTSPDINYCGMIVLLRKLLKCGCITEKELKMIAARIAAENHVTVIISI